MDMSRTASVQANLQTELLQSFQSFSLLHNAWSHEVAFSTPNSNTAPGFQGKVQVPHEGKAVLWNKPLRHSS